MGVSAAASIAQHAPHAAAIANPITPPPLEGSSPARFTSGAQLFDSRCAACHAGGANTLAPNKPLSIDSLKRDGYEGVEQIVSLLRVGRGRMPAYQGAIPKISRLSDDELEQVAAYVVQQATEGW